MNLISSRSWCDVTAQLKFVFARLIINAAARRLSAFHFFFCDQEEVEISEALTGSNFDFVNELGESIFMNEWALDIF